MGTRHLHLVKLDKNKGYHVQYLQFDGYPSYQLTRIIKDIGSKINRLEIDFGSKKHSYFREFLIAYFNYRSFDTGHSYKHFWKAPSDYLNDTGKIGNDTWAEFIYVYDAKDFTVNITNLRSAKSIKINLYDESDRKEMGLDTYGDYDENKIKAFAEKVEEELENND